MARYDARCFFPGKEEVNRGKRLYGPLTKPGDDENNYYDGKIHAGIPLGVKVGDSFDVKSFLFTPKRDFLVRNNGERVSMECLEGKIIAVVGFYIPVMKDHRVADLCRALIATYKDLVPRHDDFEVVLVARMRVNYPNQHVKAVAKAAFEHFFSAFPCLAVPFWDYACCNNLFRRIGLINVDTASGIVVNKARTVLGVNIHLFQTFGALLYPFDYKGCLYWRMAKGGGMSLEFILGCNSTSDVLRCPCRCGTQVTVSELKRKVVGVYLCTDGRKMEEIYGVYQQCKARQLDFEIVVTYQSYFSPRKSKPLMSQERLVSLLLSHNICGWLVLPFRNWVSLRLHEYYIPCNSDQLVIVGPNASCIDIHGADIMSCYGLKAYPFTKQSMIQTVVSRLRSVPLIDLLNSHGIHQLVRHGVDEPVPVSSLQGRDVYLYFGYASEDYDYIANKVPLLAWYNIINRFLRGQFEVIYVCLDSKKTPAFDVRCSEMPWLAVPYDKDRSHTLREWLVAGLPWWRTISTLVAFGPDGLIQSLLAQDHLQRELSAARAKDQPTLTISEELFRPDSDCLLREIYNMITCEAENSFQALEIYDYSLRRCSKTPRSGLGGGKLGEKWTFRKDQSK